MAGYSQMNYGYGEQPGVNWGKIAAYTGGGIMAAGVVRMGAHRLNSSTLGARGRALGAQGIRGIKSGGNWARQRGMAAYGRAGGWNGVKRGAASVLGTSQLRGLGSWASRTGRGMNKIASMSDRGRQTRYAKQYSRAKAKQMGRGMKKYFGAAGHSGMKRAGVGASRIGLGMAALDFVNPFGFGWND